MHDLSLYALELLENSVRAGATRVRTRVEIDRPRDRLTIAIEDDGPGLPVSADLATDPFFSTKAGKQTGLGLSLFREAAEAAGGFRWHGAGFPANGDTADNNHPDHACVPPGPHTTNFAGGIANLSVIHLGPFNPVGGDEIGQDTDNRSPYRCVYFIERVLTVPAP